MTGTPTKLRELKSGELNRLAAAGEFCYEIGPFRIRLQSNVGQIAELMQQLYGECHVIPSKDVVIDFRVSVKRPWSVRGIYRPQVDFYFDGDKPFSPLALNNAFPMLEWGLNWCVATTAHQYLMLHAGEVVSKSVLSEHIYEEDMDRDSNVLVQPHRFGSPRMQIRDLE